MDEAPKAELARNTSERPIEYRGETLLPGATWWFWPPSIDPDRPPGLAVTPIHVPVPALTRLPVATTKDWLAERGLLRLVEVG